MNDQSKIILIISYFGKFPEWIDLYFETIKRNSTIDFYFITDCNIEKYKFKNVKYWKTSFESFNQWVSLKLKLNFSPINPYKLCDLRPFYGVLFHEVIMGYDFYGWTDTDLLFGDIRSFYTDIILSKYNVLSTHAIRVSGHFCLVKNNKRNIQIYKRIYKWKESIETPSFIGIDEHGLTNAYLNTIFDKINEKFKIHIDNAVLRHLKKLKRRKLYLVEQYTTPFISIPWTDGSINSAQPDKWIYRDGIITNTRDANRKFIYIHFMNFKSSIWRHDGSMAPWEGKNAICFAKPSDMTRGIEISKDGIMPLNSKYEEGK